MTRASLRSDPRLRGRGRHRSPWNPRRLRPYAWYDAELGQPKYVGYVQLNGGSTDNISTPDSALNSFSNDIEVIMRVRPDDWTTGAIQTLVGKYLTTGNQRSWRFYISATGAIGLTASADGTAVTTVLVTPTTPFVDATWIWLRLRLDLTNGANSVGTVDIAADTGNNYTVPTSWTANGTNTGTTLAGVYNGTGVVEIGAFNSGTSERFAGRVGRCIVKSGFDGTTTSDFNADDCYGSGYTHIDGYYWTLGIPKIYDRSSNNRAPATFGSGTNQPLYLPWDGTPSVYLPGTAGNAISAPHAASHDITGDIEIVANVNLGSVTVAQRIVSRGTTSWGVFISASNTLGLAFRFGGSMKYGAAALGANINVPLWVKVTRSAASGLVSFYSAPDSQNEPTSWSLLGTSTPSAPGAMDPITTSIFLGGYATTGENLTGGIRKVVVRDGIGGTTVADFDASLCGQSGYTDSVGNVWAVNRSTTGRKTVVQSPVANSARSVILLGTDDSETLNAGVMPPMTATTPASVLAVHRTWGTIASNSTILDTRAANALVPGLSLRFSGETAFAVLVDSATAITTATVAAVYGAKHVVGAVLDAANIYPVVDTTIGTASARTGNDETGTSTTLLNVRPGSVGYLDSEFFGVIAVSRALAATELGLISAYYGGGL